MGKVNNTLVFWKAEQMQSLLLLLLGVACYGAGININFDTVASVDCVTRPGSAASNQSFYDFQLPDVNGKTVSFDQFKGKVVMLTNVASFWGMTPYQYPSYNRLQSMFPEDFAILAFPSGQFENQEPGNDDEILNCLKYVRPGSGFEPNFTLLSKSDVNGQNQNPVYQWIFTECVLMPQIPLMHATNLISWTPVTGSDIAWNFEKILIDKTGRPYKRYSYTSLADSPRIIADVKKLIDQKD